MRLIDPIRLKQALAVSAILEDKKTIEQIIDEQPAIEPECKTGKWIYDKYYLVHVCSECDKQALEEYTVNPRTLDRDYDEVLSEYCPHCGSRMLEIEDEDEEDEEDDQRKAD